MDKPTSANTKAEIQAYLDAQGIQYSSTATKDELLVLVEQSTTTEDVAGSDDETATPIETQEPTTETGSTDTSATVNEPEVPNDEPTVPIVSEEPVVRHYTKNQMLYMSSFPGSTKDLMYWALDDERMYTVEEAMEAVNKYVERLWW